MLTEPRHNSAQGIDEKDMATTQPRPHLGRRILGSAKGLACSTFSGVPGIEAELRDCDPLGIGKRSAGPQGRATVPVDCAKVVESTSSSTHFDFKSKWRDEVYDVDDDFAAFVNHRPISPIRQNQTPHRDSWSKWRDGGLMGKEMEYANLISPAWERRTEGEVVYQDDGRPEWQWRHEWRRLDRTRDPVLDIRNETRPLKLERELMEPEAESKALARLQQLKLHLAAMDPRTRLLQSWSEDWATQQERCDWTGDREEDRLRDVREPVERHYFSCPRKECHHRLLRQAENLSLEIRQRVCVHEGCGYVSQTVDEWLAHVTGPHHRSEQDASTKMEDQREQIHVLT